MTATRADWDELSALTEPELLERFGAQLVGGGPGPLRDGEAEESRRRSENWLQRHRQTLREKLCGSDALRTAQDDSFLEFAAVADFLTTEMLHYPAAITVAAIIAKRGVTWLCGEGPFS